MTWLKGTWVIWSGFWAAFWLVFYVPLTDNAGGLVAGAASIGAAFAPALYERWSNANQDKAKALHTVLGMRSDIPDHPDWNPVRPDTAGEESVPNHESEHGQTVHR